MNNTEIKNKLDTFFHDKLELDFEKDNIGYDENLIESGYVDSLSFLVIITFINKTFGVKVGFDDIQDESLATYNKIVSFIESHIA